ncbi:serine hydrolase domain-containing protein [Gemmatimonadota bacterium]
MIRLSTRWFPVAVLTLAATLTVPAPRKSLGQEDTPAMRRLQQLIEVINTADAAGKEEFVSNEYTPEFLDAFPMVRHLGYLTSLTDNFGGIVIDRVAASTPFRIEALARATTNERWVRITLRVESEEPYQIDQMMVQPTAAPPPSGAGGPRETNIKTWEELDGWLTEQTAADRFSGTVLVAQNGEVLFRNAYGLANKTYRVENRMDTKFNLGSLSKMFTSVAIGQLAQQGRIELDDPIGEYLSGFPAEAAVKVTVRHLLQMRSGWGDYWDHEVFVANRTELRTVADYIAFLKDMPLQFEPGSQQIHSNTSFQVLGAIIETVTGQDYFSYIRENVFGPAGMTGSDPWGARDAPGENIATGYTNQNPHDPEGTGYRWSNIYYIAATGTPAGGGYSTAADLLAFAEALRTHRLLNQEYTDLFYHGFDPDGSRSVLGMAGGAIGVNTALTLDLGRGYEIIVLSNYDMPVAMDVARVIMQLLQPE